MYLSISLRTVVLCISAVTDGEYHTVGIFMAYSIVHRGPLPRFCSAMLYNIFDLGTDRFCDIECDLGLLDAAMRENLKKVSSLRV